MRVFDKDFVTSTLTRAGLYLLAYELLKDSIVSRTKNFFLSGFKDGKDTYDPKYNRVLGKHKNVMTASCMWLEENGVLTAADVRVMTEIREFRNRIAHELPTLLLDGTRDIETEHVTQIYQLLSKIDRWWIMNFELAINEDFAGQEVEESDVKSGMMVLMEHLLAMLLAEEKAPVTAA